MRKTSVIDLFLSQQDEEFTNAVRAYEQHDMSRAFKAFERLAQKDDPQAQMNLAFMLRDGQGVAQDLVSAYMWLELAARLGDEIAIQERNRLQHRMSPQQVALANQRALAQRTAA
ncbi:MAG: sel1 repeat family protein [Magnetococcales bacterium]|nr:sel1 repeat family protein [Magnetococcales bacterium]